jgi:ribosomal protein S18 acetylase RimI-like enzyme
VARVSEGSMDVEIGVFRPEHASRFAELNREWLEEYNLMEPSNEEQLADPQGHFLSRGGQIFVALHDDTVIGTCAVVPHGVGEFELAKLAVSSEFRGQGVARRLVQRCIDYAQEQGARRVILVSNSQLHAALRLYESFGFKYGAVPEVKEYANEDVFMELNLRLI